MTIIGVVLILAIVWLLIHYVERETLLFNMNRFLVRAYWIAIHFIILAIVIAAFVGNYIDGKVIDALVRSSLGEVLVFSAVVVVVFMAFAACFEAWIGLSDISKYNFEIYAKDVDRLLTYFMCLLAVLGFFYPAINMDGEGQSRGLLACALAGLLDMVALDAYKVFMRQLMIEVRVNEKIKPRVDAFFHKLREKIQIL